MLKKILLFLLVFSLSLDFRLTGQSSRFANLNEEIEKVSLPANGRVGVAASLLENGDMFSVKGAEHFPMQGVSGLPIAMAMLQQVDAGKFKLDQKISISKHDLVPEQVHSPIRDQHPDGTHLSLDELLESTISESDGTASDVLLRLVGGPASVMGYLHDLDIQGIRVEISAREAAQDKAVQDRNWATPEQTIMLLRALQDGHGLSIASSRRLLRVMTRTPSGSELIKGDLRPGTPVAHKSGTSSAVKGFAPATNDIGIVTMPNGKHLAMAIFIADSAAAITTRNSVAAKIARLIVDSYWLQ